MKIKVASETAESLPRRKMVIIMPLKEKEEKRAVYDYAPTMMAVDLYSGLKGQRLRPSSIMTSPSSSLSSVNVDVFWRQTQTANVPHAQSSETLLTVKSEVSNLKFIISTYSFESGE